jgi:protein SCO1/2
VTALLVAALTLAADIAPPPGLEGVEVTEHVGARLPLEVELGDARQRTVRLGDLFGDGKPVLLVLAYYRCPMLCGLVLRGVADGLRALDWRAGERFRVVTVSIDPRDGWQEAGRKQATARAAAGLADDDDGWLFLTDRDGSARRLADAIGFGYRRDERSGEYAHPAAIVAATPDGRIARYLYGIEYPPRQLRLALLEASQGKVGGAFERVLMACYRWDPATRRYGVFVERFLRGGATLVLIVLAGLLTYLVRLERRKARHERAE